MTTPIIQTVPWHARPCYDERFQSLVHWAAEQVRAHEIQALAATGHSGLPFAGAVAFVTGLPLMACRKPGELTHVGTPVDTPSAYTPAIERWAWLDDLLDSGGTLYHAIRQLWDAGLITDPTPTVAVCYRHLDAGTWRIRPTERTVLNTIERWPRTTFPVVIPTNARL